jgi:hypothetical protein
MTAEPVALPEYARPIATAANEIVIASPSWWATHGDHATVFVDARAWPPAPTRFALHAGAAARLASGEWVVTAKLAGAWQLLWFADIHTITPRHAEPAPFVAEQTGGGRDAGPFRQLVAIGDMLVGIPVDLGAKHRPHVWLWRDGVWSAEPALPVHDRGNAARVVQLLDGREAIEWHERLYVATADSLATVESHGCTELTRIASGLFALHDSHLVQLVGEELQPHLEDHTVTEITPAGDALVIRLAREDERGTHSELALYEPAAARVTMLPAELVGKFPAIVACTAAGDLVLHDDRKHALTCCPAAQIAALPHLSAAELVVPQQRPLAVFDQLGAASRPLVAADGSWLAIAVGRKLRLHSLDAPITVVELDHPIVAIAAARRSFGALDANGVLHQYDHDGRCFASRPAVAHPVSLASDPRGTWIALGRDRVALIDDRRTRTLELAGAVAVDPDPEGGLVFACDGHRLVHWTAGELRDLPPTREQIVVIASLGRRQFACLGERDLYLLDLEHPELISLQRRPRRPYLATHQGVRTLAYCDSASSVTIERFDGAQLAPALAGGVSYSKYSAPADDDITVHGLAFLDDRRVVIALDEGRANIVDPESGAALKLDEQPGDAYARWVFICGGKILLAG